MKADTAITAIEVSAYEIPTETPEADGTADWKSTIVVLVSARAGNATGLGYSYADRSTAELIRGVLASRVVGQDAFDVEKCWIEMVKAVRNLGRPGIASMAISAVDAALWDLKARLLDVPLGSLLGRVRPSIPVYGSGGFTSYDDKQLAKQLSGWIEKGIGMVKMKIGRNPRWDLERVRVAREAIGPTAILMIDANGAFSAKEALRFAEEISGCRVQWFEEPVSSDDLSGLRLVRESVGHAMEVAAGEYGYDPGYFRKMLEAQAVDVLQADVTRCGGITGFMKVNTLAEAFHRPLSSHCAPAIHLHPNCAASSVRHAEYFFDHVRIERMFFEGAPEPRKGELTPSAETAGNGLAFKRDDAEAFRILP